MQKVVGSSPISRFGCTCNPLLFCAQDSAGAPTVGHRVDTRREYNRRRRPGSVRKPLADWAVAVIRTLDLL